MKPFRFPLEKALAWRRTRFEIARAQLGQRTAAVASIDRARAEVEAAGIAAEIEVRGSGDLKGRDLAALAGLRAHLRTADKRLVAARIEAERKEAEQRDATLQARREARLLERLRERRLRQWNAAALKEMEDAAAEAYLARWPRD
jgi:hypothetical protein